jgi:hypothetical protein
MTNLERVLAKAFMGIVVSIDLTDDDDIDPDVATSLLEPVAALLQSMAVTCGPAAERQSRLA